MQSEKFYNENGDIGVLLGYRKQFSTLANDVKMAIDKRVIEDFISNPNRDNVPEFLCTLGYDIDIEIFNIYCKTYEGIKLEFVPSGKNVIIIENAISLEKVMRKSLF